MVVLKVSVDEAQLRRARELVRNHEFNHPKRVIFNASEKVTKSLANEARRGAASRSGRLRKSIKAVVREERGAIFLGVQFRFYGIFVNKRTKFISKLMRPQDILKLLEREIG